VGRLKAAEQENALAQRLLGDVLSTGKLVRKMMRAR
jgi:hypothetical protein